MWKYLLSCTDPAKCSSFVCTNYKFIKIQIFILYENINTNMHLC